MDWLLDLSLAIGEDTGEPIPTRIARTGHREGVARIANRLVDLKLLDGENVFDGADLPDEEFLSNEVLSLSVHTATHLDAPFHFGTHSEGRAAPTIDEIPLEWCFGPGVLLDVSHRGPGEYITTQDIETEIGRLERPLSPGDIVLLRTGADRYWGTQDYAHLHPGMSCEATAALVERGVRVVGIDAAGFDRPLWAMAQDYAVDRDRQHLWPAHFYGRKRTYCHIERLCNLDRIPERQGFLVACFPIKIAKAGAGWARVVAMKPKPSTAVSIT